MLDAILPGVAAAEVLDRLQASRPGLRALYTSGYTGEVIRQHGLTVGQDFLQKPFRVDALTRKVRELLDAG